MLLRTTTCFSVEKLYIRKFWFIIISLALVSFQILAQSGAWHNISTLPKGGGSACALNGKIYVVGGSVPGSLTDVAYNMVFDPQTLMWEEKALMPTPRGFLFTGVVNNTIYAIGGGYPTSTNINEAYDPVTNTWTAKANMPSPWIGVRGAVANGKIYTIGGNYNAHNCFEYNPVTNTWTEKTPIPSDGGGALSATEYNGLIYTFGGSTYSPWAALSTVYAYNPQTDTWTKKRDMPTPRFALKTFLVNGKIYAIGGNHIQGTAMNKVEVYDPVTDTWSLGENMPIGIGWMTGAVVNNKIYIIGGSPDFGNTGNYIVWEYDPTQDPLAQNGWFNPTNLSTPRMGASASVVNGKIYVIGGEDSSRVLLANNEMYDPLTNTWTTKAPMPTPREFLITAVVRDTIYAIGGMLSDYSTYVLKVEAYDPITNTWKTKNNMPSGRISQNAAVVDGIIYIEGGNFDSRDCWAYNPSTDTWTQKQSIPAPGGGNSSLTLYNGLIYAIGGSTFPWYGWSYVFAYNPNTDSWTQKQSMPTARFGLQTYLVDGLIYAVGGSLYQPSALNTVEVYYPNEDRWAACPPMPQNLLWFAGASTYDHVYVFGGLTDDWGGFEKKVWACYKTGLPVELTSFTATANGKEVTLSWSTATELNNQGFEVQRKFGSNDFVTIGSVRGNGTTTSPNNYSYVDKLIDPGKYFYRLKQIDYGGTYEYSQKVEVNWSPFTTFKLEQNYPNPFNPTTTIGFGIPELSHVRMSILNILGEEIKVLLKEEKEAGYHSVGFNGSDLSSGVYFYRIQTGSFVETRKMILLR